MALLARRLLRHWGSNASQAHRGTKHSIGADMVLWNEEATRHLARDAVLGGCPYGPVALPMYGGPLARGGGGRQSGSCPPTRATA